MNWRSLVRTALIILLAWGAGLLAQSACSSASDLTEQMQAEIEGFVERDGAAVFLALYWLPETREIFVQIIGDVRWWRMRTLEEFDDMLSAHERREVLAGVAARLATFSAGEWDGYAGRLDRW